MQVLSSPPTIHPRFNLRSANESDSDFLWNLVETTMRAYITAFGEWDDTFQEMRFRCAYDPCRWHIIVADDVPVGGYAVDRHRQALYLADLQLLPSHQGNGIGSAVIRELMEEAQKLGVPLLLQVLDSNMRARRLYERLGFSFAFPSIVPHYSVMVFRA